MLEGNGDRGAGRKEWGSRGGHRDNDVTFFKDYKSLHSSQCCPRLHLAVVRVVIDVEHLVALFFKTLVLDEVFFERVEVVFINIERPCEEGRRVGEEGEGGPASKNSAACAHNFKKGGSVVDDTIPTAG